LWEIERVVSDGVEDEILQLVDNVQEVFSQGRHDAGLAVRALFGAMGRTVGATGSGLWGVRVIGDQQIDWDETGGRAKEEMAGSDSCDHPEAGGSLEEATGKAGGFLGGQRNRLFSRASHRHNVVPCCCRAAAVPSKT
jgi:hypothetical protein